MSVKWVKVRPGIRYREHPTRRHGVKLDRYWTIFYKLDGKTKTEALGWSSQGFNEKKTVAILSELQENQRRGTGPRTLSEKRKLEYERREAERKEQERQEKEDITFGQFYEDTYKPILERDKKPGSIKAEKILFEKWIKPVIGKKSFKDILALDFERIKKNMQDSKKSPSSIKYAFAVSRQIWNMASRDRLIARESPTKNVKTPKIDNRRTRFLTHDEADLLLENLAEKSQQIHDMAILSLHTGMRASEIFKLTWGNVDVSQSLIQIMDAKGGSRTAHMTDEVLKMFKRLKKGRPGPNTLVFKDRNGKRIKQISNSFDRAVNDLGLNDGATDHRQKVLFHTLRHTFASWLVQNGETLYTVQKLMGHASIAMTERYAHLAPDTLKTAVKNFEKDITTKREEKRNADKDRSVKVLKKNQETRKK